MAGTLLTPATRAAGRPAGWVAAVLPEEGGAASAIPRWLATAARRAGTRGRSGGGRAGVLPIGYIDGIAELWVGGGARRAAHPSRPLATPPLPSPLPLPKVRHPFLPSLRDEVAPSATALPVGERRHLLLPAAAIVAPVSWAVGGEEGGSSGRGGGGDRRTASTQCALPLGAAAGGAAVARAYLFLGGGRCKFLTMWASRRPWVWPDALPAGELVVLPADLCA